jgi:hypothetical protein
VLSTLYDIVLIVVIVVIALGFQGGRRDWRILIAVHSIVATGQAQYTRIVSMYAQYITDG